VGSWGEQGESPCGNAFWRDSGRIRGLLPGSFPSGGNGFQSVKVWGKELQSGGSGDRKESVNRVLAEVIVRGADRRKLLQTGLGPGAYLLGSGVGVALRLEYPGIEPMHARLWVGEGGVKLEGLAPGLRMEGQALTGPVVLLPGQRLELGDFGGRGGPGRGEKLLTLEVQIPSYDEPVKYEVGEVLANGGAGPIYSAQELNTGRLVAFKMPTAGPLEDQRRRRFLHEARITAQLEHPGVVPVYEVGDGADGVVFYTMKLVRGITLEKVLGLLAQGVAATVDKYPLGALLTVFRKVCDTVAFAHSRGVIHRSLRPGALTIGDFGEVLLMGWGTATSGRPEVGVGYGLVEAATGEEPLPDLDVDGLPYHLSPEQIHTGFWAVDEQSDVYALGVILYQILTLRPPVRPGSPGEIRERIMRGELLPLKLAKGARGRHLPGGSIPQALAAVVKRAMAPVREERYGSVAELMADVERYQEGYLTSAEGGSSWRSAWLFVQRQRKGCTAAGLGLLVVGLLAGQTWLAGRRAERALADLKGSVALLRQVAEAEVGMLRLEPALRKLEAAQELDPAHLPSLRRWGWVCAGLGRMGEAAGAMRAVLARDPQDVDAVKALKVFTPLEQKPREKWLDAERQALGSFLMEQRLFGEVLALGNALKLSQAQKGELVRARMREWLGEGANFSVVVQRDRVSLLLRDAAVVNLEPLKGLPIDVLDLRQTGVSDLGPLHGMAVSVLDISGLAVEDLSPLSGMPLKELRMRWVPAKSIAPLRSAPLEILDAPYSGVEDFTPLYGKPLTELNAGWTSAKLDLKWLEAAPLRALRMEGLGVKNLEPLKGKPLRLLVLTGGSVDSLYALEGMPLETLTLNGIGDQKSLNVLAQLSQLKSLGFSGKVPVELPEGLRRAPQLRDVWVKGQRYTVPEFWDWYDRSSLGVGGQKEEEVP
jgi:serine/threonine protein kinase